MKTEKAENLIERFDPKVDIGRPRLQEEVEKDDLHKLLLNLLERVKTLEEKNGIIN